MDDSFTNVVKIIKDFIWKNEDENYNKPYFADIPVYLNTNENYNLCFIYSLEKSSSSSN